MSTYAKHQVLELVREAAWRQLNVEVNGDSLEDLVDGIYAAGGSDALRGVIAMQQAGVNTFVVTMDDGE